MFYNSIIEMVTANMASLVSPDETSEKVLIPLAMIKYFEAGYENGLGGIFHPNAQRSALSIAEGELASPYLQSLCDSEFLESSEVESKVPAPAQNMAVLSALPKLLQEKRNLLSELVKSLVFHLGSVQALVCLQNNHWTTSEALSLRLENQLSDLWKTFWTIYRRVLQLNEQVEGEFEDRRH